VFKTKKPAVTAAGWLGSWCQVIASVTRRGDEAGDGDDADALAWKRSVYQTVSGRKSNTAAGMGFFR
jgi:hypothetical protein